MSQPSKHQSPVVNQTALLQEQFARKFVDSRSALRALTTVSPSSPRPNRKVLAFSRQASNNRQVEPSRRDRVGGSGELGPNRSRPRPKVEIKWTA